MAGTHLGRVAFICHPADLDMFKSYISHLKPDKTYRDELLIKLFEWTPSYKVIEWNNLSLDNGKTCFDAMLVMVPFLPEMRDIKLRKIIEKIDAALHIASSEGCSVAALGAFTSIVLQGQEKDFAEKHNIVLTSGNTLTASVIVRSVEELAKRKDLDLSQASMAIIGASGDIGSGIVSYFGSKVKQLALSARSVPSLEAMLASRRSDVTSEMILTSDNAVAIRDRHIVVFVTSAYVPLFSVNDFAAGTIVCDASAPLNVRLPESITNDVYLYHGGIMNMPFALDTGFDIGLASPYTFYGCQVEGLFILHDKTLPCSWGRGNISKKSMEQYLTALDRYPQCGPAYSRGKHLIKNTLVFTAH
jgi:fatty aldehyde-generating acyl-ACP reductase